MRKFYVQHLKGKTSIIEIEGEIDVAHSMLCLKEGEYVFLINRPESLKGERYMWWSMVDSEAEAVKMAYKDLEKDLELRVFKGKIKSEEAETLKLQEKPEIEVVKLK